MDEKIRKLSALIMGILTVIVSITVAVLPTVMAEENNTETEKISGLELMDYYTAQVEDQEEVLKHQMQIELPEGTTDEAVAVESDVLSQLITITIPGIDQEYYFEHPLLGSSNHIDNLMLGSEKNAGIIEITMDAVYEVQMEIKDSWLYLDFIPPGELYEKVLVIDAGHGGGQPGAVKQGIQEKDLNLAILLELKELLDQHEDWKVYYTRTDDSDVSLDQRVQLANKSHANLFLSIHNNSTHDGKMSDYNGTEVMYDEKRQEEVLGTMRFAQICLEETVAATGSRDLGLTKGNSIYIIRTSQVPVALVEVGFMTNAEELAKLNSEEYQKIAAQGIYNGIVRALEEGF